MRFGLIYAYYLPMRFAMKFHICENKFKTYVIFSFPTGELIIACMEIPKNDAARTNINIQNISFNMFSLYHTIALVCVQKRPEWTELFHCGICMSVYFIPQ